MNDLTDPKFIGFVFIGWFVLTAMLNELLDIANQLNVIGYHEPLPTAVFISGIVVVAAVLMSVLIKPMRFVAAIVAVALIWSIL